MFTDLLFQSTMERGNYRPDNTPSNPLCSSRERTRERAGERTRERAGERTRERAGERTRERAGERTREDEREGG